MSYKFGGKAKDVQMEVINFYSVSDPFGQISNQSVSVIPRV